jgi:hypothetical protein
MAKKYEPRVNDIVLIEGNGFIRYLVYRVNEKRRQVDVRTVIGLASTIDRVPWSKLYQLDEAEMQRAS